MFKNNLKIALRRFWRQKTFTIINVLGLSIGLAIAIVMLTSVKYQLSVDRFHEKGNNLYQVGVNYYLNTGEHKNYTCKGIWAEELQNNYPEIKMKTRLMPANELLFNLYDNEGNIDKKHIESKGAGVDSTFFQMFTFPLSQGVSGDVLKEPYSIVLSKKFALKYFGNENPMGQILEINNKYNFTVTGVLEELPRNTQLGFDFYFSVSFFEEFGFDVNGTNGNQFQTYLLLEEGASLDNFSATSQEFFYSRFDRDVDYEPFLLPVEDMFMHGQTMNALFSTIFGAIAIFILIMACINFMNLSTATSLKRSKEIAIRKIIGAQRKNLIGQLLSESILLAFISLNIGIVFSEIIIDFLERTTGELIPLDLGDFNLWIQLIGLALFTGVLAGSYPALFLSSFKPIKVLSFKNLKSGGGKFRKFLVVFQFTLTIIFLTLAISSYRQSQAVHNNMIGMDVQNVLSVPIKGDIKDNYEILKNDLLLNSNILSVSSANQEPTWVQNGEFLWGTSPGKNEELCRILRVNYDFLDVFNIKLTKGRFYSKDFPSDIENGIIINEEIVKLLKIEDPIGKQFYLYDQPHTIIGVIEYFNFFPIELGGKALILRYSQAEDGCVYIEYKEETFPLIADFIKETFEEHNQSYPYEYTFYSDFKTPIDGAVEGINQALTFFTIFGIFIAILGLLGLSAFMVEQKTKEIGIRKVMGASVHKIVSIITKQFFKLILIANIIAIPIAYLINAYGTSFLTARTKGDVFIFIFVFVFIFAIAFAIIYLVTVKAARANPARSLRYE